MVVNENLKEKVLRYINQHPGKTEDEIAEALNRPRNDPEVLGALIELEKDGLLKSREF